MRNDEFKTKRLQLAIYIHASRQLEFIRVEPADYGKVAFVFDDPKGIASTLELSYERGAEVAAKDLFASQSYLRREMSARKRETRTHGECTDEYAQSSR